MRIRHAIFLSTLALVSAAAAQRPPQTTMPASTTSKKLAVILASDSPLQETLAIELARQKQFALADTKEIADVIKEHRFVLTASTRAADLSALAKLVTADVLLAVVPGEKESTVYLVNTSDGEIVRQTKITPHKDPLLAAAMVREAAVPTINPADPDRTALKDPAMEIEYWRQLAIKSFPMEKSDWTLSPRGAFPADREKIELAIAAWEHLLMLAPDDSNAMLHLGATLVGSVRFKLDRNASPADVAVAVRGTQLAEAAFLADPGMFNAWSYYMLINPIEASARARALEMNEFILAHAEKFPVDVRGYARYAVLAAYPKKLTVELDAAVAKADENPEDVARIFWHSVQAGFVGQPQPRIEFAAPYVDSKNAAVRFFANYVTVQAMMEKGDPAGVKHALRMVEVIEQARDALPKNSTLRLDIDEAYRAAYSMCKVAKEDELAKKTLLAGIAHYEKAGRYNNYVASLYYIAVIHAVGESDLPLSLKLAHKFMAQEEKNPDSASGDWLREVKAFVKAHE